MTVEVGRPTRFDFVVAGVQKAGTTALYSMLSKHPQIASSGRKELHFFDDDEAVDWSDPPYDVYNRNIRSRRTSVIAGEATPRYLFWPGAMERIHAYNPDMRILVSFRDPIERAFSHWGMSVSAGWKWDFRTTISRGKDSSWPRPAAEYNNSTAKTIVARGYYGAQLAHALTIFPAEQILVIDYHRLFKDLDTSLRRITDFLGVDPFDAPPTTRAANAAPEGVVARRPTFGPVMSLADLYAEDLRLFAEVSGMDVSDWPTVQLLDGVLSAKDFAVRLAARINLISPGPDERKRRVYRVEVPRAVPPDASPVAEASAPAASESDVTTTDGSAPADATPADPAPADEQASPQAALRVPANKFARTKRKRSKARRVERKQAPADEPVPKEKKEKGRRWS